MKRLLLGLSASAAIVLAGCATPAPSAEPTLTTGRIVPPSAAERSLDGELVVMSNDCVGIRPTGSETDHLLIWQSGTTITRVDDFWQIQLLDGSVRVGDTVADARGVQMMASEIQSRFLVTGEGCISDAAADPIVITGLGDFLFMQ